MRIAVAAVLLLVGCESARQARAPVLHCSGAFAPGFTRASLGKAFGAKNVRDAEVNVGEGQTAPGSVLFEGTPSAIEVIWTNPVTVRAAPGGTDVRSYSGIRLGMDLATVESINGGPFDLTGFNWDYAGTVTSWRGGKLDAATGGACRLLVRFEPVGGYKGRELLGDRDFSSDDPRMRALNPRVYDMVLQYHR